MMMMMMTIAMFPMHISKGAPILKFAVELALIRLR